MASLIQESEETEKDADSLKPIITSLLERILDIINVNYNDVEELKKIQVRLTYDRSALQTIETKLNEDIQYFQYRITKKNEINTALETSIRERKI